MPLIQSPNPKPRRTKITVRLDEPLARTVHRYAEFIRAIASLQRALTDSCGIPAISPCSFRFPQAPLPSALGLPYFLLASLSS